VTALLLAAALAGIQAPPPEPIGRSVQGRPIGVTRVGDPAAPRKVLVVGSVHGNEPAGRSIAAVLGVAVPPPGAQLLIVRNLNPDGFQRHTRANAHGVDLNRNSPQHWAGAGPRPWSEPETLAIRALILRERPALSIWYHQPYGLVDPPEAGDPAPARRYAQLTGLPLHRLALRPGSLTRWQNARVSAGSAFVVELPRGRLTAAERDRHAAAVLDLAVGFGVAPP
jgi:murein peptide amidase A